MNLTRRLFLGRDGSVAVAAAAPVTIAALPAVAAPISAPAALATALEAAREGESPELLKLGADLAIARKRCADAQEALPAAQEALPAAQERALQLAPAIPQGLPVPFANSIFGQLGWYTLREPADIIGRPIELPHYINPRSGKSLPVRIPTAYDIIQDRQSGRRLNGGRLPAWLQGEHRRLYDLAVAFEVATEEAREASGLNDAEDELCLAKYTLTAVSLAIRRIEVRSIVGLLIKAQAANSAGSVMDEGDPNGHHIKAGWIGASLAEDFERIMSECAA